MMTKYKKEENKMSRSVYVVTRIFKGNNSHTVIPNLGIHFSKKAALEHWESVINDRMKHASVFWERDHSGTKEYDLKNTGCHRVVEKCFEYKDNSKENIFIEEWRK
jgi:hypothetical protein